MAEHIDDTKSFTITLKAAAAPAPTPTPTTGITTTWIQQNYDANGSRRIDTAEMQKAGADHDTGRISQDQFDAVMAAWRDGTLLPAPSGTPVTAKVAKGELINISSPASAVTGSTVSVSCQVKNTGTATGTFRVDLTGGNKSTRTTAFYVYAGQTSPTKSLRVMVPASGSSVTYTIKCVRTT